MSHWYVLHNLDSTLAHIRQLRVRNAFIMNLWSSLTWFTQGALLPVAFLALFSPPALVPPAILPKDPGRMGACKIPSTYALEEPAWHPLKVGIWVQLLQILKRMITILLHGLDVLHHSVCIWHLAADSMHCFSLSTIICINIANIIVGRFFVCLKNTWHFVHDRDFKFAIWFCQRCKSYTWAHTSGMLIQYSIGNAMFLASISSPQDLFCIPIQPVQSSVWSQHWCLLPYWHWPQYRESHQRPPRPLSWLLQWLPGICHQLHVRIDLIVECFVCQVRLKKVLRLSPSSPWGGPSNYFNLHISAFQLVLVRHYLCLVLQYVTSSSQDQLRWSDCKYKSSLQGWK